MSRSRRKTAITGITTAVSDKQDKQLANRAFRRRVNMALAADKEPPFTQYQVWNSASFSKDGKQYLSASVIADCPALMRK